MLIIDFNFLLYMKFFNYTADSGKLGNLPTPKAADLHPIPPRLLLKLEPGRVGCEGAPSAKAKP